MTKSMLHETTYATGTLVQEEMGLWAGWVSHGGSFSDCLPIWNQSRDVCLIFSGEHFADRSEIEGLRAAGFHCPKEDASYLMALYEKEGPHFFEKLNGVFCGILVDLRERKVVVFNDRYGMGRLYVHETPDACYFASEAKALLQVLPQLRQIDQRGWGELFGTGCVLQNRTIFSGVSLFPPASLWTFSSACPVRKEIYFDSQVWESQSALAPEQYYEKLKDTIATVLPRYFRPNEKISMSLTGGLDGRIIMAWLRRAPGTLPCYTHRGMFNECADAQVARRVAKTCGQPHRVIKVNGEFLSGFADLAKRTVYITDGAMDVSGTPGLFVNRISGREIAPIRMTGNYGGEILRGIMVLNAKKLLNPFFDRDFERSIEQGVQTLGQETKANRASLIAFKQMPWHHYSRYVLEHSQVNVRSPYLDNDLVALSFQKPADRSLNKTLAARLIEAGNPELVTFPTDRGPLGRPGFLGRIRESCQEFAFKADYAYDYGMPHWLAKTDRFLSPLHLERLFLGRHKYYHFRYFYRNQLAPVVKEILLDSRALSRPYLDRRRVEHMVKAHVSGSGNYTTEIHTLLTSELIHSQLIEQ